MILGVGTDIVAIGRIRDALARFGPRLAGRILTAGELTLYHGDSCPAAFLAKRFAAKEAAAKAFGTGFRKGLQLHDIEVIRHQDRAPALRFHGTGAAWCRDRGVIRAHLSLADEQEYATAFVVLEGATEHD